MFFVVSVFEITVFTRMYTNCKREIKTSEKTTMHLNLMKNIFTKRDGSFCMKELSAAEKKPPFSALDTFTFDISLVTSFIERK